MESELERGLVDPNFGKTSTLTLKDLIERYRDTVTPRKKSRIQETYRLNRLGNTSLADKKATQITSEDIGSFSDHVLKRWPHKPLDMI